MLLAPFLAVAASCRLQLFLSRLLVLVSLLFVSLSAATKRAKRGEALLKATHALLLLLPPFLLVPHSLMHLQSHQVL